MKKFLAAIGYILLSLVLFLGGAAITAMPAGYDGTKLQELWEDADEPPGQDRLAPAEDETEEPPVQDSYALYYYSLLDERQKEYYTQLDEAAAAGEKSVVLQGITQEEADPIFVSVQNDHPEYFWLDSSYTYRTDGGHVEFIFHYNCDDDVKNDRKAVIEQEANEILAQAPVNGSDYEKVKYVFDTLVDRIQYELNAPDSQNIYSVFGSWTSVCAGYAKSVKYLLDRLDVECIYVTGTAEGEAHAWNIVNCEGQYYCVDATWGDPAYLEGMGVDTSVTAYEYLCCPDDILSRTHTADPAFALPECRDNSMEYYRLQERYLETADQEAILNMMRADIDDSSERTEIQFSEPDIYAQVMGEIEPLLEQAMEYEMEVRNTGSSSISYQNRENGCVLVVFWSR